MKIATAQIELLCTMCGHLWEIGVPEYIDHNSAPDLARRVMAAKCLECGAGPHDQVFRKDESFTVFRFDP